MNDVFYDERKVKEIMKIFKKIDRHFENSCIWVTNIKEKVTWCSEKTRALFNIETDYASDFEYHILKYVHLFDKDEYITDIRKRLNGENLDNELLIHFLEEDGKFNMYSFHTSMIYTEDDGSPEYLVVVIRNENILSDIDAVTDLYSESKFEKDLETTIKEYEQFAVFMIHIKGFSTFNLIYGRDYTNELLKSVALKFIYMMTMETAVYHLEGERFAFILRNTSRENLIEYDKTIRKSLEEGIVVFDKRHKLKMASGAILIEKYKGDSSSLFGEATYALKQSMKNNQDRLVIFNDIVQTASGVDYALMKVIHESVRNECKGFYVEYQPIVQAKTGNIVGAEALVRWCVEPYGKVAPGTFIEWMETDPCMYDLGNFVLRKALEEVGKVLEYRPDFFVNVNVSVRQLERPEFRQAVRDILEETGFPSGQVCLELTERCKDFPLERLDSEVQFLHSCGIRVAMDDYGTGSASSNIVMNIPMDEIKIDMSFIRGIIENPKNQAMVRSIVDFANECDMDTCLEGVENEELQDYLREFNATWFQGYYYSRPISADELLGLLSN